MPWSPEMPVYRSISGMKLASATSDLAGFWAWPRARMSRRGSSFSITARGGEAPTLSLVGKGVTFDSGGLSLKPSASMEDMKSDMTGAAVVVATMQAAARLAIPVNVTGYLALTENMTGGKAMKLGDVLTMRNGKTVEVMNTDAEGRLILADALSYAVEHKPHRVIDLATLTGACMVALGPRVAGLFSNDDAFRNDLVTRAAEAVSEFGRCRSTTTTRSSSRVMSPTSRMSAANGAEPSLRRSFSNSSSARRPGSTSISPVQAGPILKTRPGTLVAPAALSEPWWPILRHGRHAASGRQSS